jgi:hypothetical protein
MERAAFANDIPAEPAEPLTGRKDKELGDCTYDFYRCGRCFGLITLPQMKWGCSEEGQLRICPCGGLKFSPTNPKWWEFLFLPRVWSFAVKRLRGLV